MTHIYVYFKIAIFVDFVRVFVDVPHLNFVMEIEKRVSPTQSLPGCKITLEPKIFHLTI